MNTKDLLPLALDLECAMSQMGRSLEQRQALMANVRNRLSYSPDKAARVLVRSIYNAIWDTVARCCKCRQLHPLEDCTADTFNRTWCVACIEAEDGAKSDRTSWEISRR
jgi:hypothetical protein